MGLTDWEAYKADAGQTFAIETTTPLHGSGSFKCNRGGTAGQYINLRRASTPRAFTSGRARWLFRVTTALLLNTFAGFAFQQSQADLTGAAGSCYWAGIALSNSGSHRLAVYRTATGLPGIGTLIGQSSSTFALAVSTTIALEVTWVLDLTNLGGIQFSMQRGSATDFSDLAAEPGVTNLVSTSTVLQTSVGEGPASILGATTQVDHLYDRLSCVPLLVGG